MTIEYRDIEIEADALVGSSSVPSLTNATWQFLKVGSELNLRETVALQCMLLYLERVLLSSGSSFGDQGGDAVLGLFPAYALYTICK